MVVKLLGGMYITWLGLRLAWRAGSPLTAGRGVARTASSLWRCYRAGLLTDLANPKTVVFFASIFATAYDPGLPAWAAVGMWAGIAVSSVLWRTGLAAAFSRSAVHTLYQRAHRPIEVVFGALLVVFGVRLTLRARA